MNADRFFEDWTNNHTFLGGRYRFTVDVDGVVRLRVNTSRSEVTHKV